MKAFIYLAALPIIFAACNKSADSNEQTVNEQDTAAAVVPAQEEVNGTVFFPNLKDSQEISQPFIVEFGVEGMQVEPAGEKKQGFGHHHLIIDGTFVPQGTVVPMSDVSRHYGKGQTQDTLKTLNPGFHTLTLQFADGFHMSYGEKLSKTIHVKVKK